MSTTKLRMSRNGKVMKELSLNKAADVVVEEGVTYSVVDAATGEVISDVVIKKADQSLIIEQNGKLLAEIKDYFSALDANFEVGGVGNVTPSTTVVDGTNVVWEAGMSLSGSLLESSVGILGAAGVSGILHSRNGSPSGALDDGSPTGGDTDGDTTTGGDTGGDTTTGGDTGGDTATGGDTGGDTATGGDTDSDTTTGTTSDDAVSDTTTGTTSDDAVSEDAAATGGQVEILVVGGPVVGTNDLIATFYQADGTTVIDSGRIGDDGSLTLDVGDYEGVISVKVTSQDPSDSAVDYIDETTGEGTDLGSAEYWSDGIQIVNGTAYLNVNILSTIAHLKSVEESSGAPLTEELVNANNGLIAGAFGLEMHSEDLVPTIDTSGSATNTDNAYGHALAMFSALDAANEGDIQASIDALAAGFTVSGGSVDISADLLTALNDAIEAHAPDMSSFVEGSLAGGGFTVGGAAANLSTPLSVKLFSGENGDVPLSGNLINSNVTAVTFKVKITPGIYEGGTIQLFMGEGQNKEIIDSTGQGGIGADDTFVEFTFTGMDLDAFLNNLGEDAAGKAFSIEATVAGGTDANISTLSSPVIADTTAPDLPVIGSIASTGGNVVSGVYNSTNDGLAVDVTISAGGATGGTAVLKYGGTEGYIELAKIENIDASATELNFSVIYENLSADLKSAFDAKEGAAASQRLVKIDLYDAAGNMTTSTGSTSLKVVQTPTQTFDVSKVWFYGYEGGTQVIPGSDNQNSAGSINADLTKIIIRPYYASKDVNDLSTTKTISTGKIQMYIDGEAVGDPISSNGGTSTQITLEGTALTDFIDLVGQGESVVTFEYIDGNGNPMPANPEATDVGFTMTVDTVAPEVPTFTVAASDQSALTTGDAAADDTVTISGTGGEDGSTINVLEGSTVLGTATVGSDGAWSVDVTTTAAAGLSFTVEAVDTSGNTSAESTVFELAGSAPAPAMVVFDLAAGDSYVTGDVPNEGVFQAEQTYEIYIVLDYGTKTPLTSGDWTEWTGAENLGADDKLYFVSTGATDEIAQAGYDDMAAAFAENRNGQIMEYGIPTTVTAMLKIFNAGAGSEAGKFATLYMTGLLTQVNSTVRLWASSGRWATLPDQWMSGQDGRVFHYKTDNPSYNSQLASFDNYLLTALPT